MTMTIFTIAGSSVKVKVAALIKGDGVDLVVEPNGRRSRTVQLTCEEADHLATALSASAAESRKDA